MLTSYIQAAMRHATYEILPDRTFYGEIAGFAGVYASAPTLEQCRDQLQEVLEGWIVLGLRWGTRCLRGGWDPTGYKRRSGLMPAFGPIKRRELIAFLKVKTPCGLVRVRGLEMIVA
jgi:hypothetical protein